MLQYTCITSKQTEKLCRMTSTERMKEDGGKDASVSGRAGPELLQKSILICRWKSLTLAPCRFGMLGRFQKKQCCASRALMICSNQDTSLRAGLLCTVRQDRLCGQLCADGGGDGGGRWIGGSLGTLSSPLAYQREMGTYAIRSGILTSTGILALLVRQTKTPRGP